MGSPDHSGATRSPGRTRPLSTVRLDSSRLALALSAGYVVVSALLGTVLLVTSGQANQRTPPPAGRTGPALPGIGPDAPQTTVDTQESTTVRTAGPGGISTVVPNGWDIVPCTNNPTCRQANDPADSSRFLRFGGSPSAAGSLYDVQSAYASAFAGTHAGYRQLRLESTTYHGFAAVVWEFEWDGDGVRRHAGALNWRTGGNDYGVYASTPATRWIETAPIFQAMVDGATP